MGGFVLSIYLAALILGLLVPVSNSDDRKDVVVATPIEQGQDQDGVGSR